MAGTACDMHAGRRGEVDGAIIAVGDGQSVCALLDGHAAVGEDQVEAALQVEREVFVRVDAHDETTSMRKELQP